MCVCVCLCLSTASALTGIGGSRLRRPARQSHSEPSQLSIKQPTLGQNYDSIRNNSLYPSVSHAPTHARAGEVKVSAQPCLNRLPTCKATLVCQECLAVLSVSLSLLWQADEKCHDSQEKTLQTRACVRSPSVSCGVNAWVHSPPIRGRPNAQCLLLLSR